MGPTQWITWRAGSRNAGVAIACPVGRRPPGSVSFTVRHSARSSGPAARWIAPSTPPPPRSELLAALTMASTRWWVISPRMIARRSSGPEETLASDPLRGLEHLEEGVDYLRVEVGAPPTLQLL